ncbi:type II toxin-antitoxin system HicA family toxin [Kroppenstedtia eburnea]|uniref:type II toxin-antitoxin system HicA family toxin n=1 Tax=Kroppenstedtia eburnea TaxID=714067 RepID=UPI00020C8C45|nr:hypothetical protein HMPREF9374_1445 [Desmospora sp. 8437]
MPSWRDLRRFCERDGWEQYKQGGDHLYYRKWENGKLKRTKVSHGTGEINKHLWRQILRKQLEVTEEYFNRKK